MLLVGQEPGFRRVPHAAPLLTKAAVAMAGAPVAAALLYRFARSRAVLLRVAGPEAVKIAMGCFAGFLLTNFTVIPQYRNFLASLDMYSGSYIDWQRTTWPLWTNIRWYVGFYLKVFAPDTAVLVLLLVSIVWIAVSGNRRLSPYLLVFLGFFLSKPLNLRAAPHHTMLWLPYVAVLCAFPAAKLYSIAAGSASAHPARRLAAVGASAVLFAFIALHLRNGPREAAGEAIGSQARLEHLIEATDWIKSRTPGGAMVAMSYSCFNPDIFYMWVRSSGVPVPEAEFDGRRYIVWWGKREQLQGLSGYACAVGGSAAALENRQMLNVRDPSQMADANSDPAFHRVAAFGNGSDEVDLFAFDLRTPGAPAR
jgi:hypothetical protein